MKPDSTKPDPDELLDKWVQQRREEVPELPKGFCREVMAALAPPKTRSVIDWSQWLAKAAALVACTATGLARSYAIIHLLFQIT